MKKMNSSSAWLALAAATVAGVAISTPAAAQMLDREQTRVALEARGGVNVPTFDIADVAKAGPSFGVGIGLAVSPRLWLMADGDLGVHGGKDDGPDVNVYHYIGKVGFDLVDPRTSRWSVIVNAGAGAMTFDVDAPDVETNTYFAINVGAKIAYALSDRVDILLSPQGDIAFSDEEELGTSDAWVWPVTAGFRFRI